MDIGFREEHREETVGTLSFTVSIGCFLQTQRPMGEFSVEAKS